MDSYKHLKNVLNYNLDKMNQFSSLFCENPETDFNHNRKLNFLTIIKNFICMETVSLNDEFLKLNDFSIVPWLLLLLCRLEIKLKLMLLRHSSTDSIGKHMSINYGKDIDWLPLTAVNCPLVIQSMMKIQPCLIK